jgi:hypothetical protein
MSDSDLRRTITPAERKRRDYVKQRRGYAKSPHGFRELWPRKKADAQGRYRRRVDQLLVRALTEPDGLDAVSPATARRPCVRKWGPGRPLGEWVESRLQERIECMAAHMCTFSVEGEDGRKRFANFLRSLLQGRRGQSHDWALLFERLLADGDDPSIGADSHERYAAQRRSYWALCLRQFLRYEPAWELRLRAWIATVTSDTPAEGPSSTC